jgi:hypothetical protein
MVRKEAVMEQKRVLGGNGRIMLCNGVCINNNYECYCRFKDKNEFSYLCREVTDYDGCDCCGRHISQLKPFGKAGDPLNGNFDGALLVKTFRSCAYPNKELDEFMNEFYGKCNSGENDESNETELNKQLNERFGIEDVENLKSYFWASHTASKSYECRNCICLSGKRYFRVRKNIYRGESSTDWW